MSLLARPWWVPLMWMLMLSCGPEGELAGDDALATTTEALTATSCRVAENGVCREGVRLCATCRCEPTPLGTSWSLRPERCFAVPVLDDDCDGQVDEGCPTHFEFGPTVATPTVGGSGGEPFSEESPAPIIALLVQSRRTSGSDKYVSGLTPGWKELAPSALPISFGSWFWMTQIGAGGGTYNEYVWFPVPEIRRVSDSLDSRCPLGQMAVGIEGRAGRYVDALSMRCAMPHLVSLDSTFAPGSFVVRFTDEAPVVGQSIHPFHGFSPGGDAFSLHCPSNSIVIGFHGRLGSWVDAVGLKCSQLLPR